MSQWIFVETATKLPATRPSQDDPLENFQDGYDPNNDPYGPSFEYMFLPVVEVQQPIVNPVLERADRISTNGHLGHYVAPNWERGWVVLAQDLATSKDIKRSLLENDFNAAISLGWDIGQYTFPYSEEFLRLLGSRKFGLAEAINEGLVPTGAEVTFSDISGKKVSVTLTQINNNFASYFRDFMVIKEKEVDAQDAITAAVDVAAVNAVSWTF